MWSGRTSRSPRGDSGLPRKASWPPAGDGRAVNPGGARPQTPPASSAPRSSASDRLLKFRAGQLAW